MKELSLHILDIAQNSLSAGARRLILSVEEAPELLTLTIADDGRGMSPGLLAAAADPFTTTRATRKVGMGLPLLLLAARQTGGDMALESCLGEGTRVTACFRPDHIDCPPLGDMAATISLLVHGLPEKTVLVYTHSAPGRSFRFDTAEVRAALGPRIPLSDPEVTLWVRDYVAEGEAGLS